MHWNALEYIGMYWNALHWDLKRIRMYNVSRVRCRKRTLGFRKTELIAGNSTRNGMDLIIELVWTWGSI